MDYEIRRVQTPDELEAVGRLRYDVYIRELDRRPPGIDDERQRLIDPEDEHSLVFAAYAGNELAASFRATPVSALAADSRWREVYGCKQFPVDESKQLLLSRLVVDRNHRASLVAPQLFNHAYTVGREGGAELCFIVSAPNMVPLYQVIGFRRYRDGVSDSDAGFRLPMVLISGDWAHFEAVKSPLLAQVHQFPPNVNLGDWFEQAYPAHSQPSASRALGVAEFLRQFAERLTDTGIPLLDDLSGEDKQRLYMAAEHIDMEAGGLLLRRGERGDRMFLLLAGAVEVSTGAGARRRVLTTLGAGQLFGEGGFLMNTPRNADVQAITSTQLLALDNASFERLAEQDPRTALLLMRNLSRMLCLRLYAGNADD